MTDTTKELLQILEAIIEREKAGGCAGCAYRKVEEWEMPCVKCNRNCKDYWRRAEVTE